LEELHLTKKDFKIDWYSSLNNKHMNCCRIKHNESGLISNITNNKPREDNQNEAFLDLTEKVIKWYYDEYKIKRLDLTDLIINDNMHHNIEERRKSCI